MESVFGHLIQTILQNWFNKDSSDTVTRLIDKIIYCTAKGIGIFPQNSIFNNEYLGNQMLYTVGGRTSFKYHTVQSNSFMMMRLTQMAELVECKY